MITKSEAIFLGIGVVMHAGFLAVAERAPAPTYHYDEPDPPAYVDIETDKEEPKEISDSPHDDVERRDQLATNTGPREHHATDRRASGPPTPSAAGEENPDTQPSENLVPESHKRADETPHDEFDEPMADNRRRAPGVGSPVWENMPGMIDTDGHGPPAPTEAPKAKKVSRDKANEVLGAALDEKDKKLGLQLAAAGTVASTVKAAVWSSAIPDQARGTIVIVLDASGNVSSVKVAAAAGGSAADWDAAAANVKASLAAKKLLLTDEYKKGAIIAVNVLSKRQLPSGSDPSSPIHLGTTSTFDVSDIGAKSIRQVTTSTNVTPVK